jgi:HEAT repeat protein
VTVFSADITRLLALLREPVPAANPEAALEARRQALGTLTVLRDVRVVPSILHLLAPGDPLSEPAQDAITFLLHRVTPASLAWVDWQARNYTYAYGEDAWWRIRPQDVAGITSAASTSVTGMLASHPNGFVREAAVDALGVLSDGVEMPFLALRANDWVPAVAGKAAEHLARRIDPANHRAIVEALPFLVRMLGYGRYSFAHLSDAIGRAFVSDSGVAAVLERIETFDAGVRRFAFRFILAEITSPGDPALVRALADTDPPVRRLAVQTLERMDDSNVGSTLERLATSDPIPSVRREAMAILTRSNPDRLRRLLPDLLLDRAAAVRNLARYLVRTLNVAVVPRDLYVERVAAPSLRRVTAAVSGIGETGHQTDVPLLVPYLSAESPSLRRAALIAMAKLDADAAASSAVSALTDPSPGVRNAAADVLRENRSVVDWVAVNDAWPRLPEMADRMRLLRILSAAPKWDAAVYLLEHLDEPDPAVHECASRLLDGWLSRFNQTQSQPTAVHLERIRQALDAGAARMSENLVRELRTIARA